jgi:hypothetical protein
MARLEALEMIHLNLSMLADQLLELKRTRVITDQKKERATPLKAVAQRLIHSITLKTVSELVVTIGRLTQKAASYPSRRAIR